MATPAATAQEYCTLLVKSRLLPADEVESLYRKWKEERPGGDERVDSFRRFIVNRRALTDYQAALVQRGRPEGFFLADYKILDRIGKGQMGGVYKAAHSSGQLVALKILPASKARNAHVLGRFQREARLLTQLDHPNVVRAFQVGDGGGVHYIAMEYLEGETLNEVLERRQRLPLAEATRLMRQALDGLQHLHDKRMVHRDVKPSNMMLIPEPVKGKPDTTWDSTIKILDIGLGRELFDEDAPEADIETQLTQEGSVLGTPDYLAPEQAKDARSADIRADVYSIGCVLYHCLAGRPPFSEQNIMAQMLRHATERAAAIATVSTEPIPQGFQAVLDRLLAKRVEDRYQTPAEASDALRPFESGGGQPAEANLVPAFRDWLTSESQTTPPKNPPNPSAAHKPLAAQPPAGKPPAPRPAPPKPGTAPVPAVAVPQAPRPYPLPAPVPVEEVDVELVTELEVPGPLVVRLAAHVPADRPLWPPDRRDWMMLAAGAAGVLSAVGLGYGLAKALRRKPEPDADEKG